MGNRFPWNEKITFGLDAAKQVLDLANILQQNKSAPELSLLIPNITSILAILNLPLLQVGGQVLPFIPMVTAIANHVRNKENMELSLSQSVELISQAAYLISLRKFLESNPDIRLMIIEVNASENASTLISMLEKIEIPFEPNEALTRFHASPLAAAYDGILSKRLQESGIDKSNADRIARRVSRHVHRDIKQAIFDMYSSLPIQLKNYANDWSRDFAEYQSLDEYLRDKISPDTTDDMMKIKWQVSPELLPINHEKPVPIQELYVPLKAQILDENFLTILGNESVDLESYVESILNNEKADKIIFIQAEPGRGKSIFCQMFANKVRELFHPIWTPILIRLRDIKEYGSNFKETLQDTVNYRFSMNGKWLNDPNTRFLFLLDGFDELLLERRTQSLAGFLSQVESFQDKCSKNLKEKGHQVIITGRPLALQEVQYIMPANLMRIRILPFDDEQQQVWLKNWGKIHGQDLALNFQHWLIQCSESVTNLAKEPLLLYLLAALYKDEDLRKSACNIADSKVVKIRIYELFIEWVLKVRPPEWLTKDLQKVRRGVLEEVGLCVVQSGGVALLSMIDSRLKGDETSKELLRKAEEALRGNSPIRTSLVCFYIQTASAEKSKHEGSFEFIHTSFAEFLCAVKLKKSMKSWTHLGLEDDSRYNISDIEMDRQIFDLFSYGAINQNIVDFLMDLLVESLSDEELITLFKRLEKFYIRWSDGDFIELINGNTDLAEKRAKDFQRYCVLLGQRQVDIYTGLNVLILLFKFNNFKRTYGKLKNIEFYPCGQYNTSSFDKNRLLRIINYSNCLKISAFNQILGSFLDGANLSHIDLSRVDLSGSSLCNADLTGTDLRRADLSGAHLDHSKLHNAYLRGADLSKVELKEADLTDADLRRAYLHLANLTGAILRRADLSGADLSDARLNDAFLRDADLVGTNLSDIRWDNGTKLINVWGLHKAIGVPDSLQSQLFFQNAIKISKGIEEIQKSNITEAKKIFWEAQENISEPVVSAIVWNKFCWLSSLYGFSNPDIIYAGEQAVQMDDRGNHRDSLGVALAISGCYQEALKHLKNAIESRDFQTVSVELKERRIEWVKSLEIENNPFSDEVLRLLRDLEP